MRILFVEDERKVASFIKKGLEAERYAVDVAHDGISGLDFAESYQYDLVILDLMLPGMSGTEVLRSIRRKDANVPILVLTARDSIDDKVKNFESGCDDYLTKPFAFAELLARVKALLRRGAVERKSILRAADLTVDLNKRRVTRAGRMIDLTVKEYALLEYLMLNAGQVVSRAMIIEHVWDHSFDSFTNIVDVYIRYLRNKIDEGFEPKLIQTVRGVGYMIKAGDEE